MEIIKKVWNFYSVKLLIALGLCALISYTTKLTVLGGAILFILAIYFFVHSFRDPAFKKKKVVTRVFIYIFVIEFLVAGFITMCGQSDSASNAIRNQISSSSASK